MTSPATDTAQQPPLTPTAQGVRGRFLWYDLMTPDVDAAIAFYTSVTGWTTGTWEMGEGMPPYTLWMNGEGMVGGTMGLPADEVAQGTPAHWLAHIGTTDCAASYEQALSLGAQSRVPPTDIPTIGRYAVLLDPQGALFSLYEPTNAPPGDWAPKNGEIGWHELNKVNVETAMSFYGQLFGWEPTMAVDMGPAGIYQLFGKGEVSSGGMSPLGDGTSAYWLLYVQVEDLARAIDAVRESGGQVLMEPMEVPGGAFVVNCVDPQGGMFALTTASTTS